MQANSFFSFFSSLPTCRSLSDVVNAFPLLHVMIWFQFSHSQIRPAGPCLLYIADMATLYITGDLPVFPVWLGGLSKTQPTVTCFDDSCERKLCMFGVKAKVGQQMCGRNQFLRHKLFQIFSKLWGNIYYMFGDTDVSALLKSLQHTHTQAHKCTQMCEYLASGCVNFTE